MYAGRVKLNKIKPKPTLHHFIISHPQSTPRTFFQNPAIPINSHLHLILFPHFSIIYFSDLKVNHLFIYNCTDLRGI